MGGVITFQQAQQDALQHLNDIKNYNIAKGVPDENAKPWRRSGNQVFSVQTLINQVQMATPAGVSYIYELATGQGNIIQR